MTTPPRFQPIIQHKSFRFTWDKPVKPLDEKSIAQLSDEDILHMRREQLLQVIRTARLTVVTPRDQSHLAEKNTELLRQLAFLARFAAQNRIHHCEECPHDAECVENVSNWF